MSYNSVCGWGPHSHCCTPAFCSPKLWVPLESSKLPMVYAIQYSGWSIIICIYIYPCIHAHIYVYTYTHVYMHTYMYIHIPMYTCTHTSVEKSMFALKLSTRSLTRSMCPPITASSTEFIPSYRTNSTEGKLCNYVCAWNRQIKK